MEPKSLKGESRDQARRFAAKAASASVRLADHQVEACSAVLDIKIRERSAADKLLGRTDTFVEGEGEHLGGGEAVTNQPLHLVAGEWLIAMARETHKLRVGIPALERWERVGGVWTQCDASSHEDRLMSADSSLGIRSDHAATVYDRPDA